MQCSFYHYICQAALIKRLVWVQMDLGVHRNYLKDYRMQKGRGG